MKLKNPLFVSVQESWCTDCSLSIVSCDMEEDLFLSAEECIALQGLIDKQWPSDVCPVEEYLTCESEVLVYCTDHWEDMFSNSLGLEYQPESEGEELEMAKPELEAPKSSISSYKKAMQTLQYVQNIHELRGHLQDAATLRSIVDNLSAAQTTTARLTSLHEFTLSSSLNTNNINPIILK